MRGKFYINKNTLKLGKFFLFFTLYPDHSRTYSLLHQTKCPLHFGATMYVLTNVERDVRRYVDDGYPSALSKVVWEEMW